MGNVLRGALLTVCARGGRARFLRCPLVSAFSRFSPGLEPGRSCGNLDREDRSSGPVLSLTPVSAVFTADTIPEPFALDLEPALMPGDILLRIFEADGSGRFLSILVFFGFFRRGQDKELPPVAGGCGSGPGHEAEDNPTPQIFLPGI